MTILTPTTQRQATPGQHRLEYPETDGQPMAESDYQLIWLVYLLNALRTYFAAEQDVYVGANLMLYYEKGNPEASVAPDIFVVKGVPNKLRDTYKVWEEGKVPDLVIEILSKSTVMKDKAMKRGLYAELGVQEYVLFDPKFKYLNPAIQGYRLVEDHYEPLTVSQLADGTYRLVSEVLGLEFRLKGDLLRLVEPETGQALLSYQEEAEARRIAEKEARYESEARQAAEARVAELEAQLQQLREGK